MKTKAPRAALAPFAQWLLRSVDLATVAAIVAAAERDFDQLMTQVVFNPELPISEEEAALDLFLHFAQEHEEAL